MQRSLTILVLTLILLPPSVAHAQATIAGSVRDTSGAVLPGVSVEAASPVLIEKTRAVVTGGTGQYRIVDLRPGTYTVTFTLPGFNTVKREGIELTGSFVATVDAELRVGAVEETITVTGETPIVDVQNVTEQRVIAHDVIDTIPTGRLHYNVAVLVSGVSISRASGNTGQDVGGSVGDIMTVLTSHGSKQDSMRVTLNGLSYGSLIGQGQYGGAVPNMSAVQEVTVDSAAVTAELGQGGVRMNLIPREGGDTFRGTFFGGFANASMQGSNFTQRLKDLGLTTPDSIKQNWDINPGLGGPILKDRLWFYGSYRYTGANNYVAGMFYNRNADNPNAWTYEPDTSRPASNDSVWKDYQLRLTGQVNPKNKIGFAYDQQYRCSCPWSVSATFAPEAGNSIKIPLQRIIDANWRYTISSRFLMEAVVMHKDERSGGRNNDITNRALNSVLEQSNNLTYRSRQSWSTFWVPSSTYRVALSYVTGANALKVGFGDNFGHVNASTYDFQPISFRFNKTVPNQLTMRADPYTATINLDHDMGLYAQDKWTSNHLTLGLGVRLDLFRNSFPVQTVGPGVLVPTRNFTFPETGNTNYNDITPHVTAAYDLFGNGKTALKVGLNKYVAGLAAQGGITAEPNPINLMVTSTTRTWTDNNHDFVPDCDLLNPAANGECDRMGNANFGKTIPGATYDHNLLTGWNHRGSDWEFVTEVQHELFPRVSVTAGYFRRWFGNFIVTDNLTVAPSDYSPYSITAPLDSRLPGGGGYAISGLYDLNPAKFGLPAANFVTRSDSYGEQIEHWNGVDVGVNARLPGGALFQGGVSTGRTVTDNCDVVRKLDNPSPLYCHVETAFLTFVKALGTYTIPKAAVLVSATFQSIPGPQLAANYTAPSIDIAPSLGRPLSGGAANATINLVAPGTMYGQRLNQLDLRVAKVLKFGRTRSTVNFDLYNATNTDAVLVENSSFGVWRRPTVILPARFGKVSVQFDF